jgi:hypothetical protein
MARAKAATASVVAVRTIVAGPAEAFPPGATLSLPADEAERLVREGHASPAPSRRSPGAAAEADDA